VHTSAASAALRSGRVTISGATTGPRTSASRSASNAATTAVPPPPPHLPHPPPGSRGRGAENEASDKPPPSPLHFTSYSMYSRARTLRMLGVLDATTNTPPPPSHPTSAPPARAAWSTASLGPRGGINLLSLLCGRVWGGWRGGGREWEAVEGGGGAAGGGGGGGGVAGGGMLGVRGVGGGGGGGVGGQSVGGAGGGRGKWDWSAADGKIVRVSGTTKDGVWRCEECGHVSKHRCAARKHVARTHLPASLRPHGCPDCSKRFVDTGQLRDHRLVAHVGGATDARNAGWW
jgi:hypothetical protein